MTIPFPRRGIPFRKSTVPVRRELPEPFFKTVSGRRFILYALGLVALVGTMFKGVGSGSSLRQDGADSRAVALTDTPRMDVAPELMHQIRTLEDFTRAPNNGAINATFKYLAGLAGPESRPLQLDWTDLNLDQALAHPEAFRGGLVKIEGGLIGIETRAFPIAGPDETVFRGYLIAHQGRTDYMVTWETRTPPPDVALSTMLEVEGVFLQAIQYEDAKGRPRLSPFIVAHSIKPLPAASVSRGFLDKFFVPTVVILCVVILVTTLFLFRKARKPATPPRYAVRPPGPGR